MRVCYEPHAGFNFSNGAVLFANGKGRDEACKGKINDAKCGKGNVMLELDMRDKEMKRCGTERAIINVRILSFHIICLTSKIKKTTERAAFNQVVCLASLVKSCWKKKVNVTS